MHGIRQQQFINEEKKHFRRFIVVSVILVVCTFATLLIYYFDLYHWQNIYMPIMDFLIVFGLLHSYCSMISLMKKHHVQRYKQIRKQLMFFFLIEVTPYGMFLLQKVYSIVIKLRIISDTIVVYGSFIRVCYIISLIYPMLQAIGMLFLKESSDPLQKISKLDLIIIYSFN